MENRADAQSSELVSTLAGIFTQLAGCKVENIDPECQQAEMFRNMGNYDGAKKEFEKVLTENPDNSFALGRLGDIELNHGDKTLALEYFNRAIAADANNAFALGSRGEYYRGVEDYKRAIDDSKRALEISPNEPYMLRTLGLSYFSLGQYQESVVELEKSFRIDPNHLMAIQAVGDALERLGRYDEALEYLNKAYQRDPSHVTTLSSRGYCFYNTNQPEKALEDFIKVCDLGGYAADIGVKQRMIKLALDLERFDVFEKYFPSYPPNADENYYAFCMKYVMAMNDKGQVEKALPMMKQFLKNLSGKQQENIQKIIDDVERQLAEQTDEQEPEGGVRPA